MPDQQDFILKHGGAVYTYGVSEEAPWEKPSIVVEK
jgi:hypothetical protein